MIRQVLRRTLPDPLRTLLRHRSALKNIPLLDFFRADRIYVFHLQPKTGGNSVSQVLRRWFFVVGDQDRRGYEQWFVENKKDISVLRNYQCLVGHFSLEGQRLPERYPEVFSSDRFRVITFLRDPLQTRISQYYYNKRTIGQEGSLEEFLMKSENIVARRFPCTEQDYKEVLDRYFFIGITEFLQESIDRLAALISKPRVRVGRRNVSLRDDQVSHLSPSLVEAYRSKNELDFLVYQYALEKFTRQGDARKL